MRAVWCMVGMLAGCAGSAETPRADAPGFGLTPEPLGIEPLPEAVLFAEPGWPVQPVVQTYFDAVGMPLEVVDQVLEPERAQALKARRNGYVSLVRGDRVESFRIAPRCGSLEQLDDWVAATAAELARELTSLVVLGEGLAHVPDGWQQQDWPADADVVAVIRAVTPEEERALVQRWEQGGRLLVLLDPEWPHPVQLLEALGVQASERQLLDPTTHVARDGTRADWANVGSQDYADHPATRTAYRQQAQAPFITRGSVDLRAPGGTVLVKPLPSTHVDVDGDGAVGAGDPPATGLAVAVERGGGRAIVIGDGLAFSKGLAVARGNQAVFFDALAWLADPGMSDRAARDSAVDMEACAAWEEGLEEPPGLPPLWSLDRVDEVRWEGEASGSLRWVDDPSGRRVDVELDDGRRVLRFRGNQRAIDWMRDLRQLPVMRTLEVSPSHPATGLDQPVLTITVMPGDHTLTVGAETYGHGMQFVGHGERVVLVANSLMRPVAYARTRLPDRRLLPLGPEAITGVRHVVGDASVGVSDAARGHFAKLQITDFAPDVPPGEPTATVVVDGDESWTLEFFEADDAILVRTAAHPTPVEVTRSAARSFLGAL